MPVPDFLVALRKKIGHDPVLLPGVAAIVTNDEGHILCARRADSGQWSLPSGICEPGEHPAQTIARELWEEAGLVVRPERILAVRGALHVEYPNGDVADYVSTLFECRLMSGTPEPRDGELLELEFFPPDQLPSMPGVDWMGLDVTERGGDAVFKWTDDWLAGPARTSLVPADFEVPLTLEGEGFRLEPLGPEHNERDYAAWSGSIEHIRSTPGFPDPDDGWPYPMSLEDNMSDMEMHARHFTERRGFTWTVLDGDDVIGCVYLYPTKLEGYDAEISSWVTGSYAHLDGVLWSTLNEWIATEWPFTSVLDHPRD